MLRLLDLWRWRQRRPGSRRPRSLVRPVVPPVPRSPADTPSQATRTHGPRANGGRGNGQGQPGSHRRVSKYRLLRRARAGASRGQGSAAPGRAEDQPLGPAQPSHGSQPRWPGPGPHPSAAQQPGTWEWPGTSAVPGTGRPAARRDVAPRGRSGAVARAAIRTQPGKGGSGILTATGTGATRARKSAQAAARENAAARQRAAAREKSAIPWYERAQRSHSAPGQRHCGLLEKILHRQWKAEELPPPQIVLAVDRLAEFPQLIKERLVTGLDAIYLGPGGVPDLDDMSSLGGMPLPSGRATWDSCAGAYGDRKVIVGSRPSPTPDVMCHEIGHALDDIDGAEDNWQSDTLAFSTLYGQCRPWMTSDFHRQSGPLGRREFFADAFAAIASSQRPALLEMLGGNTRVALSVMLYFNVRYGI